MVSTVLRNIQSEMFVIRNLSYRSVIYKNVRMMRFVNFSWKSHEILLKTLLIANLYNSENKIKTVIYKMKNLTYTTENGI